ncbi:MULTISPECIES: YqeG family HAD IIIA-type phosphatase [unclassified Sporolactobacillus]|uniref:YqeG family HAD IIIA-type phosphatase n=1 Tax=unclassified Sporolactobacillus TaxID=2628533 RepID=UPI00236788C8|nr:YqeG family HAD IIIA-type phosphatase [Sporolactobacillus sp. CQH2019]MDD9147620.1 YqeG family HAD IIIA-type phosphatase [Sporolactobacillus sp. CQH2019]
MLKKFLPDEHVESILAIRPEELKKRGVRGLITDLDNTLVAWNESHMTPELVKWFASFKKAGISVMILSNNNEKRVRTFSEPAQVPYIFRARKPFASAFRRAMKEMNLREDELVVAGDQIMTDVWGGNRIGAHTILVVPVTSSDGWATKFSRQMERLILSLMRRRGWLKWED